MNGQIGYFGLSQWWTEELTSEERRRLEEVFQPMGSGNERPLTQGNISTLGGALATPAGLLMALPGWLRATPSDQAIVRKIRTRLLKALADGCPILSRHFGYQILIGLFYRDRNDDPTALAAAIAACEDQIAVAPEAAAEFRRAYPQSPLPAHVGFKQLAIIRAKEHRFEDALRIVQEAVSQGWAGDWPERSARYSGKVPMANSDTADRT